MSLILIVLLILLIAFVLGMWLRMGEQEQRLNDLEDHADEIAPPYRKSWSGGEKR